MACPRFLVRSLLELLHQPAQDAPAAELAEHKVGTVSEFACVDSTHMMNLSAGLAMLHLCDLMHCAASTMGCYTALSTPAWDRPNPIDVEPNYLTHMRRTSAPASHTLVYLVLAM